MNTTGNKYGGRTKGTPNKLTSKIKDKLSSIISEAIDSLDLETMTKSERLKLIQLGLQYIVTKPQLEEPQQEEQKFQIEIIDRLGKNRDLDKNHKYPAFYRWCFFPSQKANRNFESLGYRIVDHMGYPGHNYFQRVPILNQLEQLYSWALCKFKFKKFSTLSLLHVKKQ